MKRTRKFDTSIYVLSSFWIGSAQKENTFQKPAKNIIRDRKLLVFTFLNLG